MRQRTVKHYGERKIQPKNCEYGVVSIPTQALEDSDMPVNRGERVAVKGVVESDGETYIKIEGE